MFCILPVSVVAVTYSSVQVVSVLDVIQFLIPSNFEIECHFLFKILASLSLSMLVRARVSVRVPDPRQKHILCMLLRKHFITCVFRAVLNCCLCYHEDSFVMMPFPLCIQFVAGCRML